jgi:hypothetical protein
LAGKRPQAAACAPQVNTLEWAQRRFARHSQHRRCDDEASPRIFPKDLRDIPEATRAAIEFVWLDDVDDALRAALTGEPSPRSLMLA